MASTIVYLLALTACCYAQPRAAQYIVPPAKLEALYPKGLRVSIPAVADGHRWRRQAEDSAKKDDSFEQELCKDKDAGEWFRLVAGDGDNCRDAVQCNASGMKAIRCPAGLFFDVKKQKCDWKDTVKNCKLKNKERKVKPLCQDGFLACGDSNCIERGLFCNGEKDCADGSDEKSCEFDIEEGKPADTIQDPVTQAPVTQGPFTPNQTPRPNPPCPVSQTTVLGRNAVCKGALLFSEEFEKSSLKDLVNWEPEIKFLDEPDYPFNLYMKDGTLTLEEGNLIISPVLLENQYREGFIHEELDLTNTCTGQMDTECKRQASGAQILPPVITGKVTTKNKFAFKFGRIEVRAKLPAGNWLLPEINLEPKDNFYWNRRYASGLIRVAFAKGNPAFAKKLYGGPVLSDSEPYRSFLMKERIGIDRWNRDFHNYTLIWKPDSIILQVDGEQYGVVDPGEGFYTSGRQHAVPHASHWMKGTVMAPLDQMFYIALGLRVGGVHDFADASDKPWGNRANKAVLKFYNDKDNWFPTWNDSDVKIDYVRVYSL